MEILVVLEVVVREAIQETVFQEYIDLVVSSMAVSALMIMVVAAVAASVAAVEILVLLLPRAVNYRVVLVAPK